MALEEEFNRVAPAGANNPMEWTDEPVPEWHGYKQDKKLIEKMLKRDEAAGMLGKCTIRDLWERNEEKLAVRYPPDPNGRDSFNHSDADYALLAHLAYYTGKNCERMQKLFEKSALARDNGEKGALYQRDSILKMVALCTDVDGSKSHVPTTTGGVTNIVTIEQQQQDTFKDMVLVKSSNAVYSPDQPFELNKEQFNAIHGGAFYEMGSEQVKNSKHAWDA
ncbi:MAG: hypothetical protein GY800_09365, partial [Planctomycetes bacterium]|nr:hypothetical protein [Planctomycetota bacterium]